VIGVLFFLRMGFLQSYSTEDEVPTSLANRLLSRGRGLSESTDLLFLAFGDPGEVMRTRGGKICFYRLIVLDSWGLLCLGISFVELLGLCTFINYRQLCALELPTYKIPQLQVPRAQCRMVIRSPPGNSRMNGRRMLDPGKVTEIPQVT